MKYQIVRTGGKFVIRKGFGPFKSYIEDPAGKPVEFDSEQAAIGVLVKRSKSDYCYAGIVVRELWIEDYCD